ncbi:MAG: hypothetical protein QGH13_05800 [Candidatus Thalassarchaeaceae archaeon]|nr:hypothetical protein [Candidatus Thalassarchaeaceae archaeon]
MKRRRIIPVYLILIALILPSGVQLSGPVDAASTCTLTGQTTPEWGVDAELIQSNGFTDQPEIFFPTDSFLAGGELAALNEGFVTSVNVSDKSYTAIRMNMVEGYRYTFCVTFASAPNQTVSSDPSADVYLMEQLDFDRYKWEELGSKEEGVGEMDPTFFSFFGWIPYRDIHAYENTRNIDFSVTFEDGGSSSSGGFFSSNSNDGMYLVLDAKNNSRNNYAPARGQNMVAQIIVLVEERILLPKTSVYMICCSLPMLLIASPILLHQKYSRGAWDSSTETVELMPMIENNTSTPSTYRNDD